MKQFWIIIPLTFLTYYSFGQNNSNIDTMRIKKFLTERIIENYKELYSKTLKCDEKKDGKYITLTFNNIPTKDNPYEGWIWSMTIPQKVILGDLNNDGLIDAIVNVIKAGGGTGGSIEENEIFVFINYKGNFELKESINSNKICGSKFGIFFPERIENNLIIGTSNCYQNNDPRCCPSLHFWTKLKYDDNGLKIEERIKK